MRKKEDWEKRKIYTASISLKKTIGLSIEDELNHYIKKFSLGGYTELYKKFLLSKLNKTANEFENWLIDLINKRAEIKKGKNSEEFRKFLVELVKKNCNETQKKRWEKYIQNEEYL